MSEPDPHHDEQAGDTLGPPIVSLRNISKTFGVVQALRGATVDFRAGTVHALVGANGAGKSTLINVMAGIVSPDSGTMLVDGEAVRIRHPSEASKLGLSFIHQELHLVPKFSVLENMMLGHVDVRGGFLRWQSARARARAVLDRLGADLPLDVPVEQLTVNQRWMVALGHALMRESRLIAMDEPTAAFAEAAVTRLFEVIDDLRRDGVAIVYVSHRLEEVLEVSEDVTVFRNGQIVGRFDTAGLDRAMLAEHIVGHKVSAPQQTAAEVGADRRVVLSVEEVVRPPVLRGVTFDIAEGEILGIAGLVGSGRTEVAHVLAGLDSPTAGTMRLNERPYAPRSSYEAIRRGVAFLPEERRSQGLVLIESVEFNANMAGVAANRWWPWLPFLSASKSRRAADSIITRFGIKTPSAKTAVANLSGGNQQKVVLGKCVRVGPRVLVLDEPTVGVDIGAREDIYRHIAELAEAGTAVVLISSDFEELLVCHRVLVLREGRVMATAVGPEISKESLTHLCYEAVVPA